MSISLKEVAKQAGVSEATASLALNNRPGVNPKTRQKIQNIAKKIGYIPSITAQTLATQKSGLIGFILPNIENGTYSLITRLIENKLRRLGYKMIFATSDNNIEYEKDMIERFVSFRTEGVIIYPIIKDNPDPSYINILSQYKIPFVFLGGYYKGINTSCVMSNYYNALMNATEYLYNKGGREFYYFGGCPSIASNTMRFQGMKDFLSTKNINISHNRYIELENTNYECAYEECNKLLDTNAKVDSIISANEYVGMAVYTSVIEHNYCVPEDISIISFNSNLPKGIRKISLSYIEQYTERQVDMALNNLFDQMKGTLTDKKEFLETKLILGDSTRR